MNKNYLRSVRWPNTDDSKTKWNFGLFHKWGIKEGNSVAIIEDFNGNVKFFEASDFTFNDGDGKVLTGRPSQLVM